MKLQGKIKINGRQYKKGDKISGFKIYPFFLIHMGMFGFSGFYMAYAATNADTTFLFMHGGIAILTYIIFYLAIFGKEQVKWLFINSALGLFGIYAEINWILSLFDKQIHDYPFSRHIIPFLYYILYTFLIRQMFLDFFNAREDADRERIVNRAYVVLSVTIYAIIYLNQPG